MTPVCDLPTASIARYLNLPWWLTVSVDLAFTALGFLFIFVVLFILVVPLILVVPFIVVVLLILSCPLFLSFWRLDSARHTHHFFGRG